MSRKNEAKTPTVSSLLQLKEAGCCWLWIKADIFQGMKIPSDACRYIFFMVKFAFNHWKATVMYH